MLLLLVALLFSLRLFCSALLLLLLLSCEPPTCATHPPHPHTPPPPQVTVRVESDDTVISLKRKLSLHLGINTDTQKLVYAGAGRQLQNGRKLNFYGIQVLHVGWAGGEGGGIGGLFPTFTGPDIFFLLF